MVFAGWSQAHCIKVDEVVVTVIQSKLLPPTVFHISGRLPLFPNFILTTLS